LVDDESVAPTLSGWWSAGGGVEDGVMVSSTFVNVEDNGAGG
jgi:hypothetical protein